MTYAPDVVGHLGANIFLKFVGQAVDGAGEHQVFPHHQPQPVANVEEEILGIVAAAPHSDGVEMSVGALAAEIALEHHLGLTCDPICGLVQIPCIERNAVAAMRAMNALNLAYFLYDTRSISFDMVVKTMYQTGINISKAFRETAEGGLARLYRRGR